MLGQKWRPEHDCTLRQIALNLVRTSYIEEPWILDNLADIWMVRRVLSFRKRRQILIVNLRDAKKFCKSEKWWFSNIYCTLKYCKYWHFYVVDRSELLAKPDGEPVEDLNDGDEADSKAKSADAAKAGDEVQPSHLWRPFKFWNKKNLDGNGIVDLIPNTVDSPKKMFTMAMSFS